MHITKATVEAKEHSRPRGKTVPIVVGAAIVIALALFFLLGNK